MTLDAANAPEMHMGFVYKQGHMMKNWKVRHFVLLRDMNKSPAVSTLSYYVEGMDTYPYGVKKLGEHVLESYRMIKTEGHYLTLEKIINGKVAEYLHFRCSLRSDLEDWLTAFVQHGVELMVPNSTRNTSFSPISLFDSLNDKGMKVEDANSVVDPMSATGSATNTVSVQEATKVLVDAASDVMCDDAPEFLVNCIIDQIIAEIPVEEARAAELVRRKEQLLRRAVEQKLLSNPCFDCDVYKRTQHRNLFGVRPFNLRVLKLKGQQLIFYNGTEFTKSYCTAGCIFNELKPADAGGHECAFSMTFVSDNNGGTLKPPVTVVMHTAGNVPLST